MPVAQQTAIQSFSQETEKEGFFCLCQRLFQRAAAAAAGQISGNRRLGTERSRSRNSLAIRESELLKGPR